MATYDEKQFENYKLQPENLASIKDAVNETTFKDENLREFVNIVTGVKNDDPIALIGAMDDVGKKGSGCDPVYEEKGIANSMNRWKLGDWQIPIKICYESMLGTIAEYALKKNTDIGDLDGTDIMTIYTMKLQEAVKLMFWRYAWFGDEAAKNVTENGGGGKITDGVKTELFTVCKGLFKQIFEQCVADASQHTTISANTKTSFAEQKSAALAKGYMTGIVDNMLMDVDSRILDDSSAVLMMTRSMASALAYDIKQTHNIIMPWEKVFDGFEVANYNGVKIARVSIWDRMIKAYEKGSAAFNLPYRAVFANPKQLMVGSPTDIVANLDIWFDHKERRNYIYATGKIGTALLEKNMFHAAY